MQIFQYQDEEKRICQEILRLKTRLSELMEQKKRLGQTPLSVVVQDGTASAQIHQQDFFLPRELAQQLGWDELDLLHFEFDQDGNLMVRRIELEDRQYTMIFDRDYSTILPFEVLRAIFPNLTCAEDIDYLPACAFQTEIQDGCLLIRHK